MAVHTQHHKSDKPSNDQGHGLRILVSEIRSLGDTIFCTPAIAALRERFPAAFIAFQVQKPYACLFENDPHLNEVIAYDPSRRHKAIWGRLRHIRHLRQKRFNTGVLLDRGERPTYLARLAGIGKLIAYQGVNIQGVRSNRIFGWMLSVKIPDTDSQGLHRAHGHLHLISSLGCDPAPRRQRLYLQPQQIAEGKTLLAACGIPEQTRFALMHPGARWVSRRWPADRFAALANTLVARGWAVGLLGGDSEKNIIRSIQEKTPNIVRTPTDTTAQLAGVIAAADLFIGNDSGPLHIAAALDVPVIGLYGANDPRVVGPDPLHSQACVLYEPLPCSPCFWCRTRFSCTVWSAYRPVVYGID